MQVKVFIASEKERRKKHLWLNKFFKNVFCQTFLLLCGWYISQFLSFKIFTVKELLHYLK